MGVEDLGSTGNVEGVGVLAVRGVQTVGVLAESGREGTRRKQF